MRGSAVSAALAVMLATSPLCAAFAQSDTRDQDIDSCSKITDSPPQSIIAACGRLLADPEVRYSVRGGGPPSPRALHE